MAEQQEKPLDERGEQLIAEAGKIFWTYGIRSVNMDDLATRMGVSKKTLYHYVSDKNDLVEKVLDHLSNELRHEIEEQLKSDKNAIDELYSLTTHVTELLKDVHPSIHFDLMKYHPATFRKLMKDQRKKVWKFIAENMERGIKEGLYREDVNIPVITTAYLARLGLFFDGDLAASGRFSMQEIRWELFRYHVRGIASEKGVKYLTKKVKKEM